LSGDKYKRKLINDDITYEN